MISAAHFIVFVADQNKARNFYQHVLRIHPRLDVPGMTEFVLTAGTVLGLMPAAGICRLLGDALCAPANGLRGELYLLVDDPSAYHARAVEAGARNVSALQRRDWGHDAAYSLDADENLLAFVRLPTA